MGGSYRQSWMQMLNLFQLHYAGGVNQITVHGYPYSGKVATARWPGWSPFEPFGPSAFSPNIDNGFSEAWGPRQPSWPDMPIISNYLARTQAFLRHGVGKTEVVILNDQLDHDGPLLVDKALASAGYHYGFVSSSQIRGDGLTWGENQLRMGHARWQALIVDGGNTLPVDVQKRLESLAHQGAPIFVVGGAGRYPAFQPASSYQEVVSALAARHITAGFSTGVDGVYSIHRRDGKGDYYWLVNTGTSAYRAHATFAGNGGGVRFDAWSGEIIPLAVVHEAPDTIATDLELQPGQTMALAFAPQLPDAPKQAPLRWSTAAALDNWTLGVESWTPGTDGYSTKIAAPLKLPAPSSPWSELAALKSTSGRATYQGRFTLPEGYHQVRLQIPESDDFWRLKVNGKDVGVDPHSREVIISSFVHPDTNDVQVEMPTTLNNRLKLEDVQVYGPLEHQTHGLRGVIKVEYAR